MALKLPYRHMHYMGEYANDAAALTFIQTQKWDDTKDGTGTPEVGMLYFNTATGATRLWTGADWVDLILADGSLAFTADQSMGGNKLTDLQWPTAKTDAASKEYVDQQRDFQESVLDKDLNTPPGAPADGARYIVAVGGVGAWLGHDNDIAQWHAGDAEWKFYTPTLGTTTLVEDESTFYVWGGASWGTWSASAVHNDLSGLQGGSSGGGGERYHMTQTQWSDLTDEGGIGNASNQHIHDDRYYTETEIGSQVAGSEGAALVGTDAKANLGSATTVEAALTFLNGQDPVKFSSGVGNPNGVVAGAAGDRYLDTSGQYIYSNTDGTNTGWKLMG